MMTLYIPKNRANFEVSVLGIDGFWEGPVPAGETNTNGEEGDGLDNVTKCEPLKKGISAYAYTY